MHLWTVAPLGWLKSLLPYFRTLDGCEILPQSRVDGQKLSAHENYSAFYLSPTGAGFFHPQYGM